MWNLDSYVKDTTHMLNILDFFRFRDGDGQRSIFTMDIKSLYTVILVWMGPKAPSTKLRFQTKTELFCRPDTAIVHTTTPKAITENGAIRKRTPESCHLKTMLFGNVVF